MKIFEKTIPDPAFFPQGSALTMGNFDGIHIGHQTLLKRVQEVGKEKGIPSVVITYFPNPGVVLGSRPDFRYLMEEREKIQLISQFGIDYLYILTFDTELSTKSAEDFLKEILVDRLRAKYIALGFNHFFGANRRGNVELLREYSSQYGYDVALFETSSYQGEKVSSSLIRKYLEMGEVFKASQLLGRFFSLAGIVTTGAKRGRTIGFPTANLQPKEGILHPGIGVYATLCYVGEKSYRSMTNIGRNPTFGESAIKFETHLFGFSGDLYNQEIRVEFVHKIRNEKTFPGVEALQSQLEKDRASSLQILEKMI